MAGIAETAGMSPGLMYRYFPSKNAIVLAIIERQLQETRAKVAELHATTDIAANLARAFENWRTGKPDVLSVQLSWDSRLKRPAIRRSPRRCVHRIG